MKKYLFTILFLLVGMPLAKAQTPIDLIYHAIPISPTFDIVEEIKQIGANVQTTVSQAKKIIMAIKTDASSIQSAVTSTFNKIKSGAILDILGNPGQSKAGFCGKDITKVKTKNVAKKLKKILLVSESDDFIYLTQKKAIKEKFFMDNVYAIYAAALIIHQEVENDVKAQIDKARSCAKEDGAECGIPSSDGGGNNEAIFAYGKTLETLDSVIRLWESVSALKARLAAIKIMRNLNPVFDKSMKDSDDEQAFLNQHEGVAKIYNSMPIGFAQLNIESVAKSLKNTSIDKVDAAAVVKQESDAIQFVSSSVEFVSPDMNEKENALAAVQDQMESLEKMNEIEGMVSKALSTHNLIKDMPQYKDQAEAYLDMQVDYKKSLDKLKASEQCAIKYLGKYFIDPHKVWSGNLPSKNANKHELRKGISGWAVNAFEVLKSGEATDAINAFVVAKDKKSSDSQEDDAYLTDSDALNKKLSQEMSVSGSNPNDIEQDTLSDDEVSALEDDPDFTKAESLNTEEDNNKKTGEAVGPSKKKESAEEARKASMLSWQIGAEAAKMLGDSTNDWGSALTDKRLIWNDTKKFYRKYLEMKYNNILRYMKSYSEADILSLVAKKIVGESQKVPDSQYQINRKDALETLGKEFKESVEEKGTNFRKNLSTYDATIDNLRKEIAELQLQGDDLTNSLREKKEEINAIKEAEKEKSFNEATAEYTAEVKFPTGNEAPSTTKIATLDKEKGAANIKAKTSKGISANKRVKELEKEVEDIKKKVRKLEEKIAKKEADLENWIYKRLTDNAPSDEYLEAVSAEKDLEDKISGEGGKLNEIHKPLKETSINAIRDFLVASNNTDPIEGFDIKATMDGITNAGVVIVNAVHEKAQEIVIEKALNNLYALGDDLYSEASYSKVQGIHDNMIAELKALSFNFEILTGSAAPLIIIRDLFVMDELLAKIDTTPEEEAFFVGSTPKDRDLKAPYSLKGFDLPPVREVFHFDAVDFKNTQTDQQLSKMGKSWYGTEYYEMDLKRRFVVKEDFLKYGGEIPKIWQVMLEDFPFVESRLPLKEILGNTEDSKDENISKNNGYCENIYFARSGVFPCVYTDSKGNERFLDINHRNKFVDVSIDENHKNLNKCPLLIGVKDGQVYHSFWDAYLEDEHEEGWVQPLFWGIIDEKYYEDKNYGWIPNRECEYSELGMLFEADDHNNLYVRNLPFKNFNMINLKSDDVSVKSIKKNKKNKRREKEEQEMNKNLVKARYSELNRNQIGDFLKHVEREKVAKEGLDEVKAEYDKGMETVYALFEENGFTPAEGFLKGFEKERDYESDFDQEKEKKQIEEDYNKALKVLNDVKKKQIEEAIAALNAIDISNNEPAQEKSRNLNALISFMQKDKDCILRLSMMDATKKDFDERLKTEKSSIAAQDKYKEKNSDTKADYSDTEEVYCVMY